MNGESEGTVKIRAEKKALKGDAFQNNVFINVYYVFVLYFRNILLLLCIYFTFVNMKSKTI